MIRELEVDLGRAAREYLRYIKARLPPPTETHSAIERMRENQVYESGLMQPIDSLARSLLPGPNAPDGAVAYQITVPNEDSLRVVGDMWFLGDRTSWKEPTEFVIALRASTDVVQEWMLSVGNAATGFRPCRTNAERRRGWQAPAEWLFVIKGPRSGNLGAQA